MTYDVLTGTLNPTHSCCFMHWCLSILSELISPEQDVIETSNSVEVFPVTCITEILILGQMGQRSRVLGPTEFFV